MHIGILLADPIHSHLLLVNSLTMDVSRRKLDAVGSAAKVLALAPAPPSADPRPVSSSIVYTHTHIIHHSNHDMTRPSPEGARIPSKRYFAASPTWNAWNKLTAADVHALREERGFEGQRVYFHLNHPIRYVRLVGLVLGVDVIAGKYVVLRVDDGSGACMEVKTELREEGDPAGMEYPSNTLVDALDVRALMGETHAVVGKGRRVDVGTVVKVKGTLDVFRGQRQLQLARIWTLRDTSQEAAAWAECAEWKRDVLSTPWILTAKQREEVDGRIEREGVEERERERRRRGWEKKKKRHAEKAEVRRRRHEEKLDKGALRGSEILPNRVTDS